MTPSDKQPGKPVDDRAIKKPDMKEKQEDPQRMAQQPPPQQPTVMPTNKVSSGMEPIQLPASFKEAFKFTKGADTSDMKLDFTFDEELAKLTEEKSGNQDMNEPPQHMSMSNPSARATSLQSPTSPATEDLNLKIASVKNVWESMPAMPTVFEHSMNNSMNHSQSLNNSMGHGSVGVPQSVSSAASVSVSDAEPVPAATQPPPQHFPSFSSVETSVSELNQRNMSDMNQRNISDMNQRNMSDLNQASVSELNQQGPPAHSRQSHPPPPPSVSQEATVSVVEAVQHKQEMSATAEPFVVSSLATQHTDSSPGLSSYMENVTTTAAQNIKAMVNEQSNVCKVKPQQQNANMMSPGMGMGQSLPLHSMGLSSSGLGSLVTTSAGPTAVPSMSSLSGIPSPPAQQPVIMAAVGGVSQYHPFSALGSTQIMTQETRVSAFIKRKYSEGKVVSRVKQCIN